MALIQILKYSEKAIVVTGDTKPIKDLLKSAGGKFNGRLTCPITKRSICGWIFSRNRQDSLEQLLRGNGVDFDRVIPSGQTNADYIADPAEIDADNFCQRNNI
jgi:hypothetical protein